VRQLRYVLALVIYVILVAALSPLVGIDFPTSILQIGIMAPIFVAVLFAQHVLSKWTKLTWATIVGGTLLANLAPPSACLAVMLGIAKSAHLSSRMGGVDMFIDGDATQEGLLSLVRGTAPFYLVGAAVCLLLLLDTARQAKGTARP
jgi:hypothetical protein